MTKKRRQYSADFKFKIALEAVGGTKTINEIASEYGVHPTVVRNWKKQLMNEGAEVFQRTTKRKTPEPRVNEAELYEQIGRLKMELESCDSRKFLTSWVPKRYKPKGTPSRRWIEGAKAQSRRFVTKKQRYFLQSLSNSVELILVTLILLLINNQCFFFSCVAKSFRSTPC